MSTSLMKQPSAFVPILISLAGLAMVFGYIGLNGVVRHVDEGGPARLFRLLMLVEIPIVLFFAVRWLPREPRQACLVLGLQAVAWIAPFAAVLFFEG